MGNGNSANVTSLAGSGLTIAQIRDQVDKLATSGQLTTKQQMALIASGFQDMNAADPSYQPLGQTGYTRATTESFDFTSTLRSLGAYKATYGDLTGAATFNGLADLFKENKPSNSLSITA